MILLLSGESFLVFKDTPYHSAMRAYPLILQLSSVGSFQTSSGIILNEIGVLDDCGLPKDDGGYIHPELHIYSTFHVPWGLQVGTKACVFQLDVVMFCGLQTSGFETEAQESHGTGEAERPWNGLPSTFFPQFAGCGMVAEVWSR